MVELHVHLLPYYPATERQACAITTAVADNLAWAATQEGAHVREITPDNLEQLFRRVPTIGPIQLGWILNTVRDLEYKLQLRRTVLKRGNVEVYANWIGVTYPEDLESRVALEFQLCRECLHSTLLDSERILQASIRMGELTAQMEKFSTLANGVIPTESYGAL